MQAAKQLFLDRGYAGTRISNITEACSISRAGFYTYFKDKREIFNLIGAESYLEIHDVINLWDTIPDPCTDGDIQNWITQYFAFMDKHGAFIFSSAQSAPQDEEFRAQSQRLQMRIIWLLGINLRNRQQAPTDAPEALGLVVGALLDRSWYHTTAQKLPVDERDTIATITRLIAGTIRTRNPGPT